MLEIAYQSVATACLAIKRFGSNLAFAFEQEFNRVTDEWIVLDDLSLDCDSPTYAEEIIL